jgi:hypothetical protein
MNLLRNRLYALTYSNHLPVVAIWGEGMAHA